MKTTFTLVIALILTLTLSAQDEFRAYKSDSKRIMTNVTVQPGFTVYTLTQALGISTSDFIVANPGISTIALEINTAISLPINPIKISPDPSRMLNPLPVRYTVSEKETLYSISKIYAQQDVQTIMDLNGKDKSALSVKEILLLGYLDWPYAYASPTIALEVPKAVLLDSKPIPTQLENHSLELIPVSSSETISIINPNLATTIDESIELSNNIHVSKGIAFCERRGGTGAELLVMHPNAKIDSKIELYNPMMNRTVEATVVSALPHNSYPDDISVVISPSVADALGALDKRFRVEMTYVTNN